jgi:hypothetical protein
MILTAIAGALRYLYGPLREDPGPEGSLDV